MDYTKKAGYLLKILVLTTCISSKIVLALSTVTACHGTQHFECDYFEMWCDDPGTRIHITQMSYGFKDYSCTNNRNRCKTASRNGCCAFKETDCFDEYSPLHAYNLYRDCSMQETCGPLQAPNNKLPSCKNELSTYAYLSYECVPFNKTNKINFCEDRVIYPYEGISNIIFEASTNRHTGNTCTCSITSLLRKITTTYADIRMFKYKTGTGSTCSSAKLTSSKPEVITRECIPAAEEEDNFIYQYVSVNGEQLTISLTDLNKSGPDDVPELIWILVENAVRIECFASRTTTTGATLPQTTPLPGTNTAKTPVPSTESLDDDDGGNTAAIAGAVVGVIVVIIIAVVVILVFVFKRRGNGPKRSISRQNTYSEQNAESIYDVINENEPDNLYDPVYEPQKQTPIYDPVYEPHTAHGDSDKTGKVEVDKASTANGTDKRIAGITKRLKTPFTKMVSYIRSIKGEDPQRKTSYDHLHVSGVTTNVSSNEEPRHAYSHMNDGKNGAAGKDIGMPTLLTSTVDQTKAKLTDTQPIKNVPSDAEIKAVGVGDFYIEFQTDVDDNNPNLVKMGEFDSSKSSLRPEPYVDVPPSLNPVRAPSPLPKPSRPVSPMMEINSKQDTKDSNPQTQDDTPYYDYADRENLKSKNVDSSEISSLKETAVDTQPDYDYALSDEGESHTDPVYEDVDKRLREASMKKHKSEADLSSRISGYEIPVTQRQTSNPEPSLLVGSVEQGLNKLHDTRKPLKPLNNIKTNQKNLDLKSELQSRLQKKKPGLVKSNPGDVNSAPQNDSDNTVIKSDNLKTKDYEMAPQKKTVLQMMKAFENK